MSGEILTWDSLVGCVNDKLGSAVVSIPSGKNTKRCVTAADVAALNALYDNVNISCSVSNAKRLITTASVTASMVDVDPDTPTPFPMPSNLYHYKQVGGTVAEFVDLGLPSGTLWATHNIGASSPYELGEKFQFGELWPHADGLNQKDGIVNATSEHDAFFAYEYHNTINGQWTINSDLDESKDAAVFNWGDGCSTPTVDDIQELVDNTTITYSNSELGFRITGSNLRTIFIPYSGYSGNNPKTEALMTKNIREKLSDKIYVYTHLLKYQTFNSVSDTILQQKVGDSDSYTCFDFYRIRPIKRNS